MAPSWASQIVIGYVCDHLLFLLKISTPAFSISLNKKVVAYDTFKLLAPKIKDPCIDMTLYDKNKNDINC